MMIRTTLVASLGRLLAVMAFVLSSPFPHMASAAERPNILIISIDDLNDWVGCLGGHGQARTPNIDRLAGRGTLFSNAHCQAPVCTPSRASLVTGLYPSSTGLYFLSPGLAGSEETRRRVTLVEHFARAGYKTMGAGKFHHNNEDKFYQHYGGRMGGFGPFPRKKLNYPTGLKLWDWGRFPQRDEDTPDFKVADFAISQLGKAHENPFLLVAGFWRPHVPMYAPPRWFEAFPLNHVQLPQVHKDDRADLPRYAQDLTIGHPAPRHSWFLEHDKWRSAVQSYLASVAFVDHQVGRVLDALDQSDYRSNTIVVLLSDHGWHLGEKERWAKRSLWENSTRVPLVVAAPGKPENKQCSAPVGLIDVFPTLLALAGLPPQPDHEGRSLAPLLEDPNADWDRPIRTTFGPGNHALRSRHWRYIRYADGSEELYDHHSDPHEWHNLAGDSQYAEQIAKLRKWLPREEKPAILSANSWGLKAWQQAEAHSDQAGK